MGKRALLLINRESRNGDQMHDEIIARLRASGLDIVLPVQGQTGLGGATENTLSEKILRYRDEVDCVIVGGGDGSLNAVAAALIETSLPLGILPLGTANDLARTLQIEADPLAACDVILNGTPHRIDVGRVNNHCFFNVAHIGLAVHVAHHISSDSKQKLGILAYGASFLRALRSMRAFRAQVECDGHTNVFRSIQLSIGNGRHFGGGMTVEEAARIDDGLFSVCNVRPLGWFDMLRAVRRFSELRAGRFASDDPVLLEKGREIVVRTRRPMTISADGEMLSTTPARFELLAQAITVFVPQAYLSPPNPESDHAVS